jgi:hypothetical protein
MKIPFKVQAVMLCEESSFVVLVGFGTDQKCKPFNVPMEPAQAKLLSVGDVLELSK